MRMRWSNVLGDLPPRGPRPDPRPAHAVHDLRPADPALPDPGDRRRPVLGGVRAEAEDGRGGRGRAPARDAAAARTRRATASTRRSSTRPTEAAAAEGRAPSRRGAVARPGLPRAGDPRRHRPTRSWSIPADLPRAARHDRVGADPDRLRQHRRAEPDHVPAAQGGARALEGGDRRRAAWSATSCRRATPSRSRSRPRTWRPRRSRG